jgi:hypothetical protein
LYAPVPPRFKGWLAMEGHSMLLWSSILPLSLAPEQALEFSIDRLCCVVFSASCVVWLATCRSGAIQG